MILTGLNSRLVIKTASFRCIKLYSQWLKRTKEVKVKGNNKFVRWWIDRWLTCDKAKYSITTMKHNKPDHRLKIFWLRKLKLLPIQLSISNLCSVMTIWKNFELLIRQVSRRTSGVKERRITRQWVSLALSMPLKAGKSMSSNETHTEKSKIA